MITILHVTSHSSDENDTDRRLTAEIPGGPDNDDVWNDDVWVEIADDDGIRGAVQLARGELLAWAKEVVRLLDGGAL